MKQFLAIHHLKRTGDFPKASDQEELEDVMEKIFKDGVVSSTHFSFRNHNSLQFQGRNDG